MIRRFELQGSMLDLELEMQFPGGPVQESAIAVVDVPYQVGSERSFGSTHRPDMEIVDGGHVWQAGEILSHFGYLNALRYGMKSEIDRIAQQSPGAPDNNGGNRQTYGRVDPKPTRGDDKNAGNNNAHGNACVGRHVHKRRPDIEVSFATGHEH